MSTPIKKKSGKGKGTSSRRGWHFFKFIKPKDKVDVKVKLIKGKHSDSNKEAVAEVVSNFLSKHPTVYSDGYRDTHSTLMREYLQEVFVDSTWEKNTSQHPFDVYSIDMRVAVENKSQIVPYRRRNNDYGSNLKLVLNATLYPSEVKVKDVVPKNDQAGLSEEVLESFMDVIVVVVDRDRHTNKLVRYSLVDGSYWNVDYDTYVGVRDLYKQLNEEDLLRELLNLINERHPDNVFVSRWLSGDLPGVYLCLRKLIMVDNPTTIE